MATPDDEMLTVLVARLLNRTHLTYGEWREVLYIAKGLAAKDSAKVEGLPVEIIRSRRKAIYRKLRLGLGIPTCGSGSGNGHPVTWTGAVR